MRLSALDLGILAFVCLLTLAIGLLAGRRSGRTSTDYFLAGRKMPWWLLGISMVATTFSTDTPNLVTDIVRRQGVAGNWVWWSFLPTGMLTVFVFAAMWRRCGVLTDVEFYEVRYSGRPAAFLRGFRAIYLGLFFNVMIMATVTLAAIKIGGVMLNLSPLWVVALGAGTTLVFTTFGGLRGVLWTDLALFILAMGGSVVAAVWVVGDPAIGGLDNLLAHAEVKSRLGIIPPLHAADGGMNWDVLLPVFLIPILVQWWSIYYPSAEPGGGGYVVQRLLAAKDERHAVLSTLLFNVAHYAVRPWPWILVALASVVVYPTLGDLQRAFPDINPNQMGHDLAYPAMLTHLPSGLRGLVVASLLAAYMSTISTQLNWGTSYLVHDVWRRFVNPTASEATLVRVGRLGTVLLIVVSSAMALTLESALDSFQILMQIGAGTGLIFILRWLWWRVNALSEITAMIVSLAIAVALQAEAFGPLESWQGFLVSVAATTVAWVTTTFVTRPTDLSRLMDFVQRSGVGGPGWAAVIRRAEARGPSLENARKLPPFWAATAAILLGLVVVYAALFGVGAWIYGDHAIAAMLLVASVLAGIFLALRFGRLVPR